MKQFLATDSIRLNDTFEKTIETVEIIQGSGFVREGDEFRSWAQFNQIYGEAAGAVFNSRQQIESFFARIGLMSIEQGDTKVITRVGDEVGNMLYDSYLANNEPVISRMDRTWRGESREKINQFLRDKPWTEVEGRLRYSDYGFSQGTASAIFIAKPETRLFETTEADFEIKLPEGCLWTINEKLLVRGLGGDSKRANITCTCGKQIEMYQVQALENGTSLSCRTCANRSTDFAAFYQSISNEGYVVIKDFEDARPTGMSRILLQCPNSSHPEYSTYQNRWMSLGARCPACSAFSVGERKVREFLQERDIEFSEQVRFDGLIGIGGRKLSYDFQIELNRKPILLEIDGGQHFAPANFGGRDTDVSKQAYQQQVEHDKIKTDFAVQKGLRLVRIQNVSSNHGFITDSLNELLSGSDINYYGSLYQKKD